MFFSLSAHWHFVWLIAASLIAGIMNAMAGGGSFISFPAMLGMGMPPVEANATNTVALWPGQLTSVAALRHDVTRNLLPVVLLTSLVGGVAGAEVLLHTEQRTFLHLLPWLMLGGALIFGISAPVSRRLRERSARRGDRTANNAGFAVESAVANLPEMQPAGVLPALRINPVLLGLALLPICFYIGYFGAGGGFLIMTVLALLGMEEMHHLNAMKVVAACASNFCAIVTFVVSGRVLWQYCLVAMVFAASGGYVGARYARRMNPTVLRAVVVLTGVSIAGYFFWRDR